MFRNPEVAAPNSAGVPDEGMPGPSGVPAVGSTPVQPGMPGQGAVDATELARQLEDARSATAEVQQKYERDLRQMQSSLQSDFSKQERKWSAERDAWKNRFQETQLKDLDAEERAKYELQITQEQLNETQARAQELEAKYHNGQFKNDDERKEAWKQWDSINKYYPPVLPFIAQAVDHIDHVVNLVGIDHVGIGSDFDGGGGLADCADVADYPKITAELLKRGYSTKEVDKIWGGNFLRVFRAVEKIGKQNKSLADCAD